MSKNRTSTPHTLSSRRTGIDRRWIHSDNHHPERRRSGDRRVIRRRSLSEPLEPNETVENRELFPEFNFETSQPEAKNPAISFDEKAFPALPEAIFRKKS